MHYLHYTIKHLGYCLKSGQYARAWEMIKDQWRYGCCETDIWSLDATLAAFILPRLRYYRDCGCSGSPCGLETTDAWEKIVDKMIYAMEACISEMGNLKPEEVKNHCKNPSKEQKKVNEGLRLFGKYFQHLWT